MNDSDTLLKQILRTLGWRLRLGDLLLWASRTLWVAVGLSLLLALAGRLFPIAHLWLWAGLPLLAWALGLAGFVLLRPLAPLQIAQRVDQQLALRERLATAVELHERQAHDQLSERQQEDARAIAAKLNPAQLRLRYERPPLLVAAALLLLVLGLFMLPNPQDMVLAEQQAVRETLAQTDQQLSELAQAISEDTQLSAEDREQLLREIEALQEQLRANQGDRQEALADIADAEARLRQRLDPNDDARRAALEQMARNLESLSGQQPSQRPSLEEAANQLNQLARQLEQMSPEERQQLAEQLSQQANQLASSDPQTARNLQNAANALQQDEAQSAAQQLQQAAESVQAAQSQMSNQQNTQQSLSELQNAREQVAQAGQQQQAAQAQPGQEGQEGQQGQQGGQEGQQGQQGGQEGQQGQSQGQQPGAGGGSNAPHLGEGQSENNGQVNPHGSANQQGSGSSSDDLVYQPFNPNAQPGDPDFIQGQHGQGGTTQSQQGQQDLPGVANAPMVPYSQVLPNYSQSASEAIDRGYIPSHRRDLVRDYFARLEPSQ